VNVGYLDTSCLVAVAFGERGYRAIVAQLDSFDRLYSSNLLEAELRAAFQRERVAADGQLLGRLAWVLPDRPLSAEIGAVLAAGQLRGADLWHVACALYLSPDPQELAFLTMDRSQAMVATRMGFPGART
jgi:predicted nucleic acid-binding protein